MKTCCPLLHRGGVGSCRSMLRLKEPTTNLDWRTPHSPPRLLQNPLENIKTGVGGDTISNATPSWELVWSFGWSDVSFPQAEWDHGGMTLNCSCQPFSNRFQCVTAECIIIFFLSYSEVSPRDQFWGHTQLNFLCVYGKFGNGKLKELRQSKWTSAESQDLNCTRSALLILGSYYLTDLKVEQWHSWTIWTFWKPP